MKHICLNNSLTKLLLLFNLRDLNNIFNEVLESRVEGEIPGLRQTFGSKVEDICPSAICQV